MPRPDQKRSGDEPRPREDDATRRDDDEDSEEPAELPEREALSVFGVSIGSHPIVIEPPHDA